MRSTISDTEENKNPQPLELLLEEYHIRGLMFHIPIFNKHRDLADEIVHEINNGREKDLDKIYYMFWEKSMVEERGNSFIYMSEESKKLLYKTKPHESRFYSTIIVKLNEYRSEYENLIKTK